MLRQFYRLACFSLLFYACQYLAVAQSVQDEAEIKGILQQRIDKDKQSVGIVVGLVDDKGTRIISYGTLKKDSNQEVDGNTVFEIGSVSKVFTTLLLADMVERGEVSLNDPISKFLPKSVKTPSKDGKQITLLDLATQTSGLPRLPNNLTPKDPANPYADYTVEQMYAFLSGYTLTREIGASYEYSNLGVGLLGHILTLAAGMDYETLVLTRICKPLKMDSTRIKLTPELRARLATGHDQSGNPVESWDIPTLAGAGAIRSTANDLLKFVAANMGLVKTDLYPAMLKTQLDRHSTTIPDVDIGLGWHILKKYGTEIIWHNGGTGGYRSFIGFDKSAKTGVVVLSNSANSIDDIALHLLNSKNPLSKIEPPKEHKAIKLDPKIYDAYTGQYELTPNIILTVSREGDSLYLQPTGQGKFELFPESKTEFFVKTVDAQITFVREENGQVTKLILHQNGQDIPAKKTK